MMSLSRLFPLLLCLPLCSFSLMAEESVREVGTAFTCYFQNDGDNKHADSTWVDYVPSSRNWTESQMAAVERALLTWDEAIGNTPVRRLSVGLFWMDFAAQNKGGALAAANSPIDQDTMAYPTAMDATIAENVWRLGRDVSRDNTFDIHIYFNTRASFYDGEAPEVTTLGQYDLQTVATHELGHALGFMSLTKENGTFRRLGNSHHYTALDGLMVNADGVVPIEKAKNDPNGVGFTPGEALHLQNTDIYVYNPTYWEDASSMSHITDEEALMYHMMNPGTVRRELSASDIAVMSAMGWDMVEPAVEGVPEPTVASLSLLGLALQAARRRRND